MNAKLNELLNLKKKSEASVEKKKKFTELLYKEIVRRGINEDTVNIIEKGFSFEGARALALYFDSLSPTKKSETIQLLLRIKAFKTNFKGISFKILVSLFANLLLISNPDNNIIINSVLSELPKKSKNKDGEILGDANITIKKYVIQILNVKTKFPVLKSLGISENNISALKNIFASTTNNMKNLTKNEKEIINNILQSIELSFSTNVKNANINTFKAATKKQNKNKRILTKKSDAPKAKNNKQGSDKQTIIQLEKKLKELNHKLEHYEKEKKALNERYNSIHEELDISQKNNDELNKKNLSLQNDLQKQTNILNIFEKNAQSSKKEMLNSIAAKLKCEYMDFISAKNIPMTVDLGENLRDQINTIFQLLEKNGITPILKKYIEKEEL